MPANECEPVTAFGVWSFLGLYQRNLACSTMPTLEQVFCKFGEVAEATQLLETDLGTMMLHFKGVEHDLYAGDKSELATEICNQINKSTLGQLLRQVSQPAGFSDD